jgi:hypothetical protein
LNNKLRLISQESLGKLARGWTAVSNLAQHGHYSVLIFDAAGAVTAPLPWKETSNGTRSRARFNAG